MRFIQVYSTLQQEQIKDAENFVKLSKLDDFQMKELENFVNFKKTIQYGSTVKSLTL